MAFFAPKNFARPVPAPDAMDGAFFGGSGSCGDASISTATTDFFATFPRFFSRVVNRLRAAVRSAASLLFSERRRYRLRAFDRYLA